MSRVLPVHWNAAEAADRAERLRLAQEGLGLASGLVDYKICAIDPTWSGLCFTQRRPR